MFEAPLASTPDPGRAAGTGGDPAGGARPGAREELPLGRQEGLSVRPGARANCAAWRRAAAPSSPGSSSASTWSRRCAARCAHAGCRFPENLRVDVQATVGLPQRGEDWLRGGDRLAGAAAEASPGRPRLVVREGTANVPETAAGQGAHQHRARGGRVPRSEGLFRRNDLAFAEDTEINRSVSREHAHIQFRPRDRRVPPVQRPLVPRGARRDAAPGSCATA